MKSAAGHVIRGVFRCPQWRVKGGQGFPAPVKCRGVRFRRLVDGRRYNGKVAILKWSLPDRSRGIGRTILASTTLAREDALEQTPPPGGRGASILLFKASRIGAGGR